METHHFQRNYKIYRTNGLDGSSTDTACYIMQSFWIAISKKVLPLINILIDSYKQIFSPGNTIVNETMVPWRGRLTFRQYIPTKSHKYDIKLYKLCFTEGYTWSAKVYSRRNITERRIYRNCTVQQNIYAQFRNVVPVEERWNDNTRR